MCGCINFVTAPFNCLAGIILLFFVVIDIFCLAFLKLNLFYPYGLPPYILSTYVHILIHVYVYALFSYSLFLTLTSQCESVAFERSINCTGKVFGINIYAIAIRFVTTVSTFVVIVSTSQVMYIYISRLQYRHNQQAHKKSVCIYSEAVHRDQQQ